VQYSICLTPVALGNFSGGLRYSRAPPNNTLRFQKVEKSANTSDVLSNNLKPHGGFEAQYHAQLDLLQQVSGIEKLTPTEFSISTEQSRARSNARLLLFSARTACLIKTCQLHFRYTWLILIRLAYWTLHFRIRKQMTLHLFSWSVTFT